MKTIFGETNIATMTMPDAKKLPVVLWQGAINVYNLLYKDHTRLVDKAEHMLDWTNTEGRVLKERFGEREKQIKDVREINRLLYERLVGIERYLAQATQ
jgi:hypothetical protein